MYFLESSTTKAEHFSKWRRHCLSPARCSSSSSRRFWQSIKNNISLILSAAVLLWLEDGKSTRWQVLSLSQVWADPCVFVSWGENLAGESLEAAAGGQKESSGPRRRRGSFDIQGFVSAAGSAETKVKLPSRNNRWPFLFSHVASRRHSAQWRVARGERSQSY